MSYNNSNFYSSYFPPQYQNTFQRPEFVPPPPPPPTFFIPPVFQHPVSDQDYDLEFIKKYEKIPNKSLKYKPQKMPINVIKEKLRNVVLTINSLNEKEKVLNESKNTITDTEWNYLMSDIQEGTSFINESMKSLNDSYLDLLRKALAKRSAKRLRQKRVRQEKKKEKENRIKAMEEKSRKIDENLQKIKDEILKAKQDEDAKLEADIVLKEVLRKKHDAKKCITKLDSLLKLYKARQNTARGRGEDVSETDAASFTKNIGKLKTLWTQKLHQYEKEEADLRATLKHHDEQHNSSERKEAEFLDNLKRWREFMFRAELPQVDFKGDIGSFVAVRSQWDQFISADGSTLPIGWVLPNIKYQN